jgi:hypothetical protein
VILPTGHIAFMIIKSSNLHCKIEVSPLNIINVIRFFGKIMQNKFLIQSFSKQNGQRGLTKHK